MLKEKLSSIIYMISHNKIFKNKINNQADIFNQIKESLDRQFDKQCPPYPADKAIMTDKKLILEEFKKWYDFWDSKDPKITDINFDFQNKNNKLLLMKKQICGDRKIGILKELESIGLVKEFLECNIRHGMI